jgi:hypothetical protein
VQSVKKVLNESSKKSKKNEKNGKSKSSSKDKKSKDSKKSHKKKKGKKVPLHYTANAAPQIAIDGDLDPAIFQQCKEKMRPVKKALKLLGSLDPESSSTPRQETECLLKIGARILECIKAYQNESQNKEWRNHLWTFVAKFTEYSPRRIYKMYKNALKGYSSSHHDHRQPHPPTTNSSYPKNKTLLPFPDQQNHHYPHHSQPKMGSHHKRPNDLHSLSPNKRPRPEDTFDMFPGFSGFPSVPPHLPPPVCRTGAPYGDGPNRRNIPPPMRGMQGQHMPPSTSSGHFNPHFGTFAHGHRGGGDATSKNWNRPLASGSGPPLLHRGPQVKPLIPPMSSTSAINPNAGNNNNSR